MKRGNGVANYSGLAEIYDTLADDFDYPRWADYYAEIIARAGARLDKVCDCGCGTGLMTIELARRGASVVGVDISGEMLAVAAKNARAAGHKVVFVRQDMCALELPGNVSVITCACDGVNYLASDARLNAFFERAYANLKPGGCLAFDFSARAKLENRLGNAFFAEDRGDIAYIWQNTWDAATLSVNMDITFFVRESSGLYRRFDENHRQRAHSPEHIAALLAAVGFENINAYGDQTFSAPSEKDMRVHMTANKPGRQ